MFSRRAIVALAVAASLTLPAARTAAQELPPAKIGLVNPVKVFQEMQETKDLKQAMDGQRQAIENEGKQRGDQVVEANKKRNLFEEGTAEFNKANQEAINLRVSFEAWKQLVKMDLDRQQKMQMIRLFGRIEAATKEVAEARKLDVVLIEQKVDMPRAETLDQMTPDQVRGLINQRNVMYSNGQLDITADVLKRVDENYKNKK